MAKQSRIYEPHLAIREVSLPPGAEWTPRFPGWTMFQIGSGSGYFMQPKTSHVLDSGMVVLLAADTQGNLRVSQLGGLSVFCFSVEPERLTGLITLDEKSFFETAASDAGFSLKVFPCHGTIASRMKTLCSEQARAGSVFRLQLIQLFFEAFGDGIREEAPKPEVTLDARERLQEFLKQTPASDLLDMNFSELAQVARCTPRHLSRIFHEVVGSSFREKHTELRLARACELLATTESKVVDVAMESGYQSLSLFNLMFTRRFGMSPGRWRQLRRGNKPTPRGRQKAAVPEFA